MVINATNNSISGLTSLIQSERIQNRINTNSKRLPKVIPFPNKQIIKNDIEQANFASLKNNKIAADFTSQMYLHLLLVAGSNTLHKTRQLSCK